jgi:hypothetical protein
VALQASFDSAIRIKLPCFVLSSRAFVSRRPHLPDPRSGPRGSFEREPSSRNGDAPQRCVLAHMKPNEGAKGSRSVSFDPIGLLHPTIPNSTPRVPPALAPHSAPRNHPNDLRQSLHQTSRVFLASSLTLCRPLGLSGRSSVLRRLLDLPPRPSLSEAADRALASTSNFDTDKSDPLGLKRRGVELPRSPSLSRSGLGMHVLALQLTGLSK